jgi:hypothetical protein
VAKMPSVLFTRLAATQASHQGALPRQFLQRVKIAIRILRQNGLSLDELFHRIPYFVQIGIAIRNEHGYLSLRDLPSLQSLSSILPNVENKPAHSRIDPALAQIGTLQHICEHTSSLEGTLPFHLLRATCGCPADHHNRSRLARIQRSLREPAGRDGEMEFILVVVRPCQELMAWTNQLCLGE